MRSLFCLTFLCMGLLSNLCSAPLRIVCLHTVLTEICNRIGGNDVQVVGLLPPGVDPHTFDPAPKQVVQIHQADLVVAIGLGLEPYLERIATSTASSPQILRVGDQLHLTLETHDNNHDHVEANHSAAHVDPHWWHGIPEVIEATDLICTKLSQLRPESAAQFSANAIAYKTSLKNLLNWAKSEIDQIPEVNRHLVTNHDAFGYLARDLGLTLHSLGGLSTESEPDARQLAQVIDTIRRHHIKAVFPESNLRSQVIRNLAKETGITVGRALEAAGLGTTQSGTETYEKMYKHNVDSLLQALR